MNSKNKIFYQKIITIVIIVSLILLPFELYFRNKVHDLNKKKQIIVSRLDSTVVAIMGSSHTNFGIDPNYISLPATNFAFPAQSLYYDCKLIDKYYSRMPSLKFVIFDLSIHTFGYNEYQSSPRECFFYKKEFGIPLEHQTYFDIRDYSALALSLTTVFPDNLFNYIDKNIFSEKPNGGSAAIINNDGFQENGFFYNSTVVKAEFNDQEGLDRVAAQFGGLDSSNVEPITELLDKTINDLKKNGIEVIFVTVPCHKSYYKHIDIKSRSDFFIRVNYFTNKYKIKYFNYLDDSRFTLEDFADIDHLNYIGAKKFSKIINEDLFKSSTGY